MFVCHGNICRSPMAEYLCKDILQKQGRAAEFHVASCAVSDEEVWNGIGNPVYPPVKKLLLEKGISCEGKRAVQLTRADYDKYDLFIGMDSANIRNMHRILGGDPQNKIRKLMDYTPKGGDVADPWYTRRFDVTYADVKAGCEGLLSKLTYK